MKDLHTLKYMFMQLMYILDRRQKRSLCYMFMAVLVSALLETLSVSVMLPFIQLFTDIDSLRKNRYIASAMRTFHFDNNESVILVIGGTIILVFLVKNIGLAISSYLLVRCKANFVSSLRCQMMESYMKRPYSFFVNNDIGNVMRGIFGDVGSVEAMVDYVFHIGSEGLVIICIGLYIIYKDPVMALGVLIVAFLCFGVIILVLKKKMSRLGVINRQASGDAYTIAIQIVQGIKDVIVRRRQESFQSRFNDAVERSRVASIQSQFANLLPERVIETISIIGIIAVVITRVLIIGNSTEFVADVAVFAVAAFRVLPAISRITGYINLLIYLRPGLNGTYEDIRAARTYMEQISLTNRDTELEKVFNLSFSDSIVMNHVYWKYSEDGNFVLKDLFLRINKGEAVGIIGESGVGKSTISDILLGLYKPQMGTVEVDEYNIFDIPDAWSKMMGYVSQTVYLMDDTIRNNVAFGENNIENDAVWQALERASLKDYVMELPEGLDTMVGEGGIKLSGGQRQRIAIARALYFKPDILILDEATSALDNDTEKSVMEAIESLQGTMTIIIIAHRLTTIRKCDRVYEIHDGIAEEIDKSKIFL